MAPSSMEASPDAECTKQNDSVDEDDASTTSISSSSVSEDEEEEMPLFKYARLVGSLPRQGETKQDATLAKQCSCAAMAKIVLTPSLDGPASQPGAASISSPDSLSPHNTMRVSHVVCLGFRDSNELRLMDARTGASLVSPSKLGVSEAAGATSNIFDSISRNSKINRESHDMVDVQFDASGTILAALRSNGDAAIFELKHTTSPPPGTNTNAKTNSANPQTTATTLVVGGIRLNYSSATHAKPTCCVVDPAYKRRREKALLVGFADGRLVLTKRGALFSRRVDTVLFQGLTKLEAVTWRGNFIAWADASGLKVFDMESMTRIAHVDRPAGARPELYHPTITSLKPTLYFEQSDSLLVGWGDCVMSLGICEVPSKQRGPTKNSHNSVPVVRKRTIECTMAWELDCVSCGIVPLDANHIAVLGLVSPSKKDDDNDNVEINQTNILELQVISRTEGTVTSSDALRLPKKKDTTEVIGESAAGYSLLSSFALSRMDDVMEAEEEELNGEDEVDLPFVPALGSNPSDLSGEKNDNIVNGVGDDSNVNLGPLQLPQQQKRTFSDSHLKWSIKNVISPDEFQGDQEDGHEEEEDDARTVDSDDYTFLFQPSKVSTDTNNTASLAIVSTPPIMVIHSPDDVVLVRTRDADDAVSHVRMSGKHGLALRRALQHKRQLRRHGLNQLVDEYLTALLCLNSERTVTLRRVQLAAQAMPMLLGGHVSMWERWTNEFSKLPGGLFVLREHLPVRDPKLPAVLYENALDKMLQEVEGMIQSVADGEEKVPVEVSTTTGGSSGHLLKDAAATQFLNALRAWGPTSAIRERIKLHNKYYIKKLGTSSSSSYHPTKQKQQPNPALEQADADLHARMNQSSAGYLQPQLPAQSKAQNNHAANLPTGITNDSLYDMQRVTLSLSSRLNCLQSAKTASRSGSIILDSAVAYEAMAETYFMKGQYVEALKFFLLLGACHSSQSEPAWENTAIEFVNETPVDIPSASSTTATTVTSVTLLPTHSYQHVLAMIESHNMQRCLLQNGFLPDIDIPIEMLLDTSKGKEILTKQTLLSQPISALICLIGLELCGQFLVENCAAPIGSATDSSTQNEEGASNLPLDMVADQLRSRPKLLHWYLHLIFVHKPELYVKFPSTAVPPRVITDLHRTHLELYVEYDAGHDLSEKEKDNRSLVDVQSFQTVNQTSPFKEFLKATLPLGGARSVDVRRLLEARRAGRNDAKLLDTFDATQKPTSTFPHLFALELAFVIEESESGLPEDAKTVLNLYLEGVKSLLLAVSFAQRNTTHSAMLWDELVAHCLPNVDKEQNNDDVEEGLLFGSLLEAAAQCGADLAVLVKQIPENMRIEGLRPKLVAAVADYRLKLKMHETAADSLQKDKVALLRELTHRSNRGHRVVLPTPSPEKPRTNVPITTNESPKRVSRVRTSPKDRRLFRTRHVVALPIR